MRKTTKEVAKETVDKYANITDVNFGLKEQKKCALIEVQAIINLNIDYHGREIGNNLGKVAYWEEIKREVEKIK